jgi:P4 family phage/plasmid primase-like protien
MMSGDNVKVLNWLNSHSSEKSAETIQFNLYGDKNGTFNLSYDDLPEFCELIQRHPTTYIIAEQVMKSAVNRFMYFFIDIDFKKTEMGGKELDEEVLMFGDVSQTISSIVESIKTTMKEHLKKKMSILTEMRTDKHGKIYGVHLRTNYEIKKKEYKQKLELIIKETSHKKYLDTSVKGLRLPFSGRGKQSDGTLSYYVFTDKNWKRTTKKMGFLINSPNIWEKTEEEEKGEEKKEIKREIKGDQTTKDDEEKYCDWLEDVIKSLPEILAETYDDFVKVMMTLKNLSFEGFIAEENALYLVHLFGAKIPSKYEEDKIDKLFNDYHEKNENRYLFRYLLELVEKHCEKRDIKRIKKGYKQIRDKKALILDTFYNEPNHGGDCDLFFDLGYAKNYIFDGRDIWSYFKRTAIWKKKQEKQLINIIRKKLGKDYKRIIGGGIEAKYATKKKGIREELTAMKLKDLDDEKDIYEKRFKKKVVMIEKEEREEQKELKARISQLNSATYVGGVVKFLLDKITWEEFDEMRDKHPFKLSAKNGMIDLYTGNLVERTKEDYCTKMLNLEYHPKDASKKMKHFESFIGDIMLDKAENIEALQVLLGYGLLGEKRERKMAIWHNASGSNGKSALQRVILSVMGDYADTCDRSLIEKETTRRNGSSHNQSLAEIEGKRMLFLSELDDDTPINEKNLKSITGGDKMKARRAYEAESRTFESIGLPILLTNKLPCFSMDKAIWNRIMLFPFNAIFVDEPQTKQERKKDDGIEREIVENYREEVLLWLVFGAIQYLKEGLKFPEDVRKATDKYHSHSNSVQGFIKRFGIVSDKKEFKDHRDILLDYRRFCEENELHKLKVAEFEQLMREKGFILDKNKGGRKWKVRFSVSDAEESEEDTEE